MLWGGVCAAFARRPFHTRALQRAQPDWRGIVGDWSDSHLIVYGPNGWKIDSLWYLDGKELHFRALRDECENRRQVLEGSPWRKTS